MFERFTDRARKAMAFANQEAQKFNHEYIGTEHILLGIIKEGSGVAAYVIKNLVPGFDIKGARLEVEKRVQAGPEIITLGKLPQTPCSKAVIEFAIEEAKGLRNNYVGTEHLLLGLLREVRHKGQKNIAREILLEQGITLEKAKAEIEKILQLDYVKERIEEEEKEDEEARLSAIAEMVAKVLKKQYGRIKTTKENPIKCKILFINTVSSLSVEETEIRINKFLELQIEPVLEWPPIAFKQDEDGLIILFYREKGL